MFTLINTGLITTTLIIIFVFWIRPLLKQTPAFKALYDREESFFAALRLKVQGSKQKLTAAFITFASSAVMIYNTITPAMTGVDITPLTSHVPTWAWPLLAIGFTALMNYFRTLADENHAKKIDALASVINDDQKVADALDKVK